MLGKPRKIKNPRMLEIAWDDYRRYCDNKSVLAHEFSSKLGKFVSENIDKSVTYTVEGFCKFIRLSRSAFYNTYVKDKSYEDIVTRIREECEVDAREKFELGIIPSQLASLWMGKYGYSVKQETSVNATLDTEKTKLDALIEQMKGG